MNACKVDSILAKEIHPACRWTSGVTATLLLLLVLGLQTAELPASGSIHGVVENASQDRVPLAGAEIVLRVKVDGEFIIAAEGVADRDGRFLFEDIPADPDYIYLVGANHNGVHYPGPRVKLDHQLPHARIVIPVHDTLAAENPLVVRQHHISIRSEPGVLRVSERLLIENPTSLTYIGSTTGSADQLVTASLSIPSDFRRATFDQEFFGRHFKVIDGRLETDIPWTPGKRELSLTYVLPDADRERIWQRTLDLPCDELRIEVHTDSPAEIDCQPALASTRKSRSVIFESRDGGLPHGHQIRIELQRVPLSLATHGRWIALATLLGGIFTTSLIKMVRSGRGRTEPGTPIKSRQVTHES